MLLWGGGNAEEKKMPYVVFECPLMVISTLHMIFLAITVTIESHLRNNVGTLLLRIRDY